MPSQVLYADKGKSILFSPILKTSNALVFSMDSSQKVLYLVDQNISKIYN